MPTGYYVNNEYVTEELKENPPELPDIAQLSRTVLADHPRVTRFPIPFDEAPVDLPLDPSLTADLTMDEMAQDGGMGDGYGGQQLYGSGGMGEDADMGGGVYGSGEQGGMGQQAGGFTFAPPMASMAT